MVLNIKSNDIDQIFDDGNLNSINGGIDNIYKLFDSSIDKGIDSNSIDERRSKYGENINPEPKMTTFIELLIDALKGDTTVIILIVAAIVSLILAFLSTPEPGEKSPYIEGIAILIAVVIVAFVTAINDYSKEKQFRKLNKVKENKSVKVIRDGHACSIGAFDLVIGDIVTLDTGDAIPADGFLIESFHISVDQSAMTGEAEFVNKSISDDLILLSGCQVVEGVGKMIIARVGPNTEWGKTIAHLQDEPDPTPLQDKLEVVAETIGWIGVAAAILTFLAQFGNWIYDIYYNPDSGDDIFERAFEITGFLINAITIVVVAVPEGLPLAVTISLAYSMSKMMKDNNLVRKLEACETMGGATDICSDKTGTLTQNKMKVVDSWFGNENFNKDSLDSIKIKYPVPTKLFSDNVSINSTASLTASNDIIGNQTECAVLRMVNDTFNCDFVAYRKKLSNFVLRKEAFSSQRKCSSVLVKEEFSDNGFIYTKGAAEIVLNMCTRYHNGQEEVMLTDDIKLSILNTIEEMSSRALRVLCVAHKQLSEQEVKHYSNDGSLLEDDLCVTGIVGIQDPLRPEAKQAVKDCQNAGLFIRMVTGDNINTAKAIAREAGILTDDGIAMEGQEFRKLSEDKMKQILPSLQVLARSSPRDKFVLVKTLKKMGRVCCVTGDGTNDAPALKKADVGLSMGLSGTEVAKEASDIVILDDNFASIVKSISWGRCVYDNIRKFLQFQLTVNLVALTTAFVAALCEYGTPLTAVQLLWVNLIMDTLAALALATEPPSLDSLKRKPYGRNDNIISNTMWRNIICQGIFQLILQYFVLVHGPSYFNIQPLSIEHTTLSFNVFVFCQIFNEFNCRRVGNENDIFSGLLNNMMFVFIAIITIIVQVIFIEYGGSFTQTVPLSSELWIFTILSSFLSIPLGFIYRFIPISNSSNNNNNKRKIKDE